MVKFKDGPMACEVQNQDSFLLTFTPLRTECIRLLEVHEHRTPDRYWQAGDPQAKPPRTANARTRLKVCLTFTFDANNKPIFPPANTRLSDELVYFATKFLKNTDRARDYPYDFDHRGDINPTRVPSGAAPIIWAHGLPFFPVYKGYYILCGRRHAKWIGWLLNQKEYNLTIRFPIWTIGPVVAPGSAVELTSTRSVERQLRVHKASYTRDFENGSEHSERARDVVSSLHCDLSIVPRVDGYCLRPIYEIPGYTVHCGPDWENGRAADVVEECVFRDCGEDFDYAVALEVPYANQRWPLAEDKVRTCEGEDGDKDRRDPSDDGHSLDSIQDEQTHETQVEDYETTHDDQACFKMEKKQIGSAHDQHNPKENQRIDVDQDQRTDESQDQNHQTTKNRSMRTAQTRSRFNSWRRIAVPEAEVQALITKTQKHFDDERESIGGGVPEGIIGSLKWAFKEVNKGMRREDASAFPPTKKLKTTSTCTHEDGETFFHPRLAGPDSNSQVTEQRTDHLDVPSCGRTHEESISANVGHNEEQTRTFDQHMVMDVEIEMATDQESRHNEQVEGTEDI